MKIFLVAFIAIAISATLLYFWWNSRLEEALEVSGELKKFISNILPKCTIKEKTSCSEDEAQYTIIYKKEKK
ncbi:MAG: hypothetical protein DRN04_06420 [Thermoprotei archaeon]|nr:MAG: hypothetical protein DRN04_06420 [Thermoprotei archaeon]